MSIAEINRPSFESSSLGDISYFVNSNSHSSEAVDTLTPGQKRTAEIVFNASVIRTARSHVHNPFSIVRRRNIRSLLTIYDSLQTSVEENSGIPHVQKMADELRQRKEEIYVRAKEWHTPVQLRHAVLQAVKDVRELDESYLTLLYERTTLKTDEVERLKAEIPSWKESIGVLDGGQKITAEAVCARLLLQKCRDAAKKDEKGNSIPKADRGQDVVRLLAAHIRIQQGNQGKTPQEEWDDARAQDMLPALEKGRDKIFDKAQYWKKQDQKSKIASAAKDFKKFENNKVLCNLTGLTQAQIEEAKKGRRIEWLATGALAIGNELLSHAPGVAVITPTINLQDHLPSNPWILGGATALLYGSMAGVLLRNSFLNVDLLKTGISLDPWSKANFDKATEHEKKEAIKGSIKYHLLWEVPFMSTALIIAARYGWDVALTYFNAATIAGLTKNTVINGTLETFKWGRNLIRRRDLQKI